VARELRVSVFVVRTWWEDDHLRARISRCLDINAEPATELVTASPEQLTEQFNAWLKDVVQES
jgi:hypothetical protein